MLWLLVFISVLLVGLDVLVGRHHSRKSAIVGLDGDLDADETLFELPWQSRVSVASALLAVACMSFYGGAQFVRTAIDTATQGDVISAGILVVIAFFFFAGWAHALSYCIGGAMNQICEKSWPGRNSWPKVLDYLYYSAGGVFLFFVVLQASTTPASEAWFSVTFGIFVLNIKLLKTSIELFPDMYANKVAVRNFERKTVVSTVWR